MELNMNININLLTKVGLTLVAGIMYFAAIPMIHAIISKFNSKQRLGEKRMVFIKKFLAFLLFSSLLFVIAIIWGIDLRGVLIFASSFFALVGIALFASWSVLSNLTAGLLILFFFPYRIGDRIRVVGDEAGIEGIIRDMSLFHVQIEQADNNMIYYPNNLVIQKAIVKSSS
jgi:small-conductance mechanosensitive channel